MDPHVSGQRSPPSWRSRVLFGVFLILLGVGLLVLAVSLIPGVVVGAAPEPEQSPAPAIISAIAGLISAIAGLIGAFTGLLAVRNKAKSRAPQKGSTGVAPD